MMKQTKMPTAPGRGTCLLTLRSPTHALKAQTLLQRMGLPVKSVKLDGEYARRGCTHGLRFESRLRGRIEAALKENGIPYSAVFDE